VRILSINNFMAYYIPSHNLVFIHIPKTGGTSILHWIKNNFEYQKISAKHATIFQWEKTIGHSANYFCVVRNPYHRILSWYHYQGKMLNYKKIKKSKFNRTEVKKLYESGINNAFNDIPNCMFNNYILKPQTRFFRSDINFVLKQENLETDFKKIQDFTKCYKPLPFVNKSKNNNNISVLNDNTKYKIGLWYKKDFYHLGYNI
jgi:hypothetical protein